MHVSLCLGCIEQYLYKWLTTYLPRWRVRNWDDGIGDVSLWGRRPAEWTDGGDRLDRVGYQVGCDLPEVDKKKRETERESF